MNIFVSHPNPYISAAALDDKRVVKMCLETAQILSTVVYSKDPEFHAETGLYKSTHSKHPVVRWAMASDSNALWTWHHLNGLLMEYTARYGRVHACQKLLEPLRQFVDRTDADYEVDEFCNCTGYKGIPVPMAYMSYLCDKWEQDVREPTWYGERR